MKHAYRRHILLSLALAAGGGFNAMAASGPQIPATTSLRPAAGAEVSAADTQLTGTPVSFTLVRPSTSTTALLAAVARSVGYEVLVEPSAQKVLDASGAGSGTRMTYTFTKRPFNQVWPVLLDVYGLSYEISNMGGNAMIRITERPRQATLKAPAGVELGTLANSLRLAFGALDATGAASGSTLNSASLRIDADPATRAIIVRGTNREIGQVGRVFDGIAGQLAEAARAQAEQQERAAKDAAFLAAEKAADERAAAAKKSAEEQAAAAKKAAEAAAAAKKATEAAAAAEPTVTTYGAKGNVSELKSALSEQFPNLRITAIGSSARLVISGAKGDVDRAMSLLPLIDAAPASAPATTRAQAVYHANGDAASLKSTLEIQVQGLTLSVTGPNILVFSGSAEAVNAASKLLGQIDPPKPAQPTVAAPAQAIFTLSSLVDDKGKIDAENAKAAVKFIQEQYPSLKVALYPGSSKVLLTGDQATVDAAGKLVAQLNPATANSTQRIFKLNNAKAGELLGVLLGRTSITTTTQPATGTATSGAAASTPTPTTVTSTTLKPLDPALNIVADARTNSLIASGTPEQLDGVAALIAELDRRVPQINLQVRVEEVDNEALNKLGMTWKVGAGGFAIGTSDAGATAGWDAANLANPFSILPSITALEKQSKSRKVYDGNATMQSGQDSVGSGGDTQGTQNGSKGAAATIKTGGKLEINIPSSSGNIQKTIDYGMVLDFFSPRVREDGSVTVHVKGQLNSLNTPITGGMIPSILDFRNSEAESTITLQDGQTLILGGLGGDTSTKSTAGVPGLSKIPVLGALFGTQTNQNDGKQLLIIITAKVQR